MFKIDLNQKVPVGSFKQKANWFLVGFVFGCIFIIILLLYVMQKSEAKALMLNSVSEHPEYYVE
jgi:hypothetical protein